MSAPNESAATADVLGALARFGRAGGPTRERPIAPTGELWCRLVDEIEHHGLLGLAGRAVETGAVIGDDAALTRLAGREQRWQAHALVVEAQLADIESRFAAHGVEAIVFKGPALAHGAYPDPSWRVFGDLDLLVRPECLNDAMAILEREVDARRVLPTERPGYDTSFAKDIPFRTSRAEIDLHRAPVPGPYAMRSVDPWWAGTRRVSVGGTTITTFDPTLTLIHTACNAALGDIPTKLGVLRDVVEVAGCGDLDLDRVVAVASELGVRAPLRWAAVRVQQTFGPQPSSVLEALTTLSVTRREIATLSACRHRYRRVLRHVGSAWAIEGLADRCRYVRGMLLPSGAHRRARGGGVLSRASSGLRT